MTVEELSTALDARETGWEPIPTDALPRPVADLVRAGAKALNCDEALVAALTLPVLAAAVGNSYRVAVNVTGENRLFSGFAYSLLAAR